MKSISKRLNKQNLSIIKYKKRARAWSWSENQDA